MTRAAVLGRPVAHSLSPALHRAAYSALGLDWTYEAIDCGVAELPVVLAERTGWAGFSCTMPLKHAVLDVAAEVRPTAAAVGSANTLYPGPDGWVAENTDVDGVLGALAGAGVALAGRDVTILGAGGTAQAVVAALARAGSGDVTVLVRDPSRAAAVSATAGRLGVALTIGTLGADTPPAGVLVSTLPAGAADGFAARRWPRDQVLLDVIYAPWPTVLASAVTAAGGTVVGGAAMLLHQAVRQVELMTGRPGPLDAMRAALPA